MIEIDILIVVIMIKIDKVLVNYIILRLDIVEVVCYFMEIDILMVSDYCRYIKILKVCCCYIISFEIKINCKKYNNYLYNYYYIENGYN